MDRQKKVPHWKTTERLLEKLKKMTPEESRQTFLDAGIIDENGNLTEPYLPKEDIHE